VKYIGAIDDNHQDMKTVKITFYKTRLMLFWITRTSNKTTVAIGLLY
jgi:hypothetical protein